MLTPRELDTLGLISRGLTHHQAAQLLGVKTSTVQSHSKWMRRKLGARSNAHAVSVAFQRGILR